MKLKFVAAACVAFCGFGAQAAAPKTQAIPCDTASSAINMVATCAPVLTYYAGGSTAAGDAVKVAALKAFDPNKPIAYLNLEKNSNVWGLMGVLGANSNTGSAGVGKIALILFNGTNGSLAGVNQVYSTLASGSIENGVDQKEYITLKALTNTESYTAPGKKFDIITKAAATAEGYTLKGPVDATGGAGEIYQSADTTKINNIVRSFPTIVLPAARNTNFATGWGVDGQKVMHLALSDVRPSEATPGQIYKNKVLDSTIPPQKIAMQGFGIAVNGAFYVDLVKRDADAGKLDSSCKTSVTVSSGVLSGVTAACQPSLSRADVASMMSGKLKSVASIVPGSAVTNITYFRRPNSSGTQASAHMYFLNQGSYAIGSKVTGAADNALGAIGQEWALVNDQGVAALSGCTSVIAYGLTPLSTATCNGTGDVITGIKASAGYAFGAVAASKLNAGFADADGSNMKGAFVKLEGISPNFNTDGTEDSKARVGMLAGYPFAFELVALVPTAQKDPYSSLSKMLISNMKDAANNIGGLLYFDASTNAATYSRGGNNYKPLTLITN